MPLSPQDHEGSAAVDRNVEMLREVLDGFNAHDLAAILSHFAED